MKEEFDYYRFENQRFRQKTQLSGNVSCLFWSLSLRHVLRLPINAT